MAKRVVDVEFWNDEKVELYTPEEKYFWLFLLTNPFTTQCGIYHITLKQMSFYLGYDTETCKKLIERFEKDYQVVRFIENELAIKNYLKFAIVKGGQPIELQIDRELKNVKNKELIAWVFANLENKKENLTQTIVNILNNKNNYINANVNANAYACTHERTHERTQKFTPPTIEQVQAYCKERNNNVNAKRFYDYYSANDWKDSKGKQVKNWKQKIITWERDEKPTKELELPKYDTSKNKDISDQEAQELKALMGKD